MKSIAEMPTQCIKPSDHPFIGQSHPRLPIRSLKENCSHAEQYRRWVNDMPCRSTERSDEKSRWIDHFEVSKVVPMHTVNLDVDSLEVTRWWRYFLVEIGILDRRDRVFRDFTQKKRKHTRKFNATSIPIKSNSPVNLIGNYARIFYFVPFYCCITHALFHFFSLMYKFTFFFPYHLSHTPVTLKI